MAEHKCEIREEFTRHQIDEATFRAETAAYIKNAAQDIKDIKESFDKSTDAQWVAIDTLKDGLASETKNRAVADTKLEGNIRMAGYAKIISILSSLALMSAGAYIFVR